MLSPTNPDQRKLATAALTAHLWDLRAQAEAKLRCLTRLEQQIVEYGRFQNDNDRRVKRQHILTDLNDIVTISKSLHDVAAQALQEATNLP